MTILLLGRGKTAAPLGALLHAAKRPFLVASRTIQPNCPFNQATFDWLDEETYENPFLKASIENGLDPITAVWLVPPPVFDMAPPMIAFIDFARRRGVSRFVLLSGSTVEIGGPFMGQVHQYMASLKDIEYSVLRGTWFMRTYDLISHHSSR
jgi:festuclavine dehydrogenase